MFEPSRTDLLLGLRPILPLSLSTDKTLELEGFQNLILRPILKFQHEVLIQVVKSFTLKTNPNFFEESAEKRELFIQASLAKNSALKNQITGMIIGLMTKEELNVFLKQQSEFSKRICQMAAQRILSSISELEH